LDDECISVGITTYTVTTGALPTGVSLDGASGAITGNPSNRGSGTVGFTATDDNGSTESSWVSWNVVS